MRSLFGVLGVLIVVAVLGLVVKAQLKPPAPAQIESAGASTGGTSPTPAQTTTQVRDQVNAALQAAPKPDADK